MIKEEIDIQKEIEKYFTESAGFGRDKIQNFMDIVNKALKQKGERIAELEELLINSKNLSDTIEKAQKEHLADLEKENAELKRDKEDLIFIRNQNAKCMCEDKENLAKAKELLKHWANSYGYIDIALCKQTQQFLNEVKK